MLLINCKVELKLRRTNHCALAVGGVENDDTYSDIYFTVKEKNYMSLLSLYLQRTIKNYQNFLAKSLKDQCIEMNINQKVRIKLQQMIIDIFSNQNL